MFFCPTVCTVEYKRFTALYYGQLCKFTIHIHTYTMEKGPRDLIMFGNRNSTLKRKVIFKKLITKLNIMQSTFFENYIKK